MNMKVGIIGAGAVGRAYAALLAQNGHSPFLWAPRNPIQPSSADAVEIVAYGAISSNTQAGVLARPESLAEMDAVIFCVLGNAHKAVMDRVAPYLHDHQLILISSHCSLSALYLFELLQGRGVQVPVFAIATTVVGASIRGERVFTPMLRGEIDVAAIPCSALPSGINALAELFGNRFVPSDDLLSISLSNLNPQIHLANSMLNLTRIEKSESWDNFGYITECVGRLIERLDEERLAAAAAFGVRVRTVQEHYLKSYENLLPGSSVGAMAQAIAAQRSEGTPGPRTLATRYLTEDLPFGIAVTIALGRVAGVPMTLHAAGLALLSAACGHEFEEDNDLLAVLGLDACSGVELQRRVRGS